MAGQLEELSRSQHTAVVQLLVGNKGNKPTNTPANVLVHNTSEAARTERSYLLQSIVCNNQVPATNGS